MRLFNLLRKSCFLWLAGLFWFFVLLTPRAVIDLPLSHSDRAQNFYNGICAYNHGNKQQAVIFLKKAAQAGCYAANWKLAYMYAAGDGVQQDYKTAKSFFTKLIKTRLSIISPDAAYVSDALVRLGCYAKEGVAAASGLPNIKQARHLFLQAAIIFRNAEAEYLLGQMFLQESNTKKNRLQAARWFGLAAAKGNVLAQENLGKLLLQMNQPSGAIIVLNKAYHHSEGEQKRYVAFLEHILLSLHSRLDP